MKRKMSRFKRVSVLVLVLSVITGIYGLLSSNEAIAQVRPALVKNVDEPGRIPWETRSQFLPNAGGCYGSSDCYNYSEGPSFARFDLRPVPTGKRWVVQSVTGVLVNGNGRTNNIELGSPRGFLLFDGTKWAFGGPFSAGTSFNSAIFSANLYATFGPGETPFVNVVATPSLSGYSVIVFNGYLIDAN
jgi:hypothetical protein